MLMQSISLERLVLAGILSGSDASKKELLENLTEEDFSDTNHREFFVAARQTYFTVDSITMDSILKQAEGSASMSAVSELAQILLEQEAIQSDFKSTISTLKAYTLTRNATITAKNLFTSLSKEPERLNDAMQCVRSYSDSLVELLDKTQHSIVDKETDSVTLLRDMVLDYQNQLANPDSIIKTHLKDFDDIIGGWKKRKLHIIAARPSVGKSAFAGQMALNTVCNHPGNVILFSLEMDPKDILTRILASSYKKPINDIINLKFQIDSSRHQFLKKLHILDDCYTISEMKTATAKIRRKYGGLSMIIIDYVQKMDVQKKESRVLEIQEITKELCKMAKEFDVAILALAQLNRGLESRTDKRPQLSDLRESGAIEQDADTVTFLYRDDYHSPTGPNPTDFSVTELILAKNRVGKKGTAMVKFIPSLGRFTNLVIKQEK